MPETKQKYFLGRKVKGEQIVPAGSGKVEFGAALEAQMLLNNKGYFVGNIDESNPIPFTYDDFALCQKWSNLSKEDKAKLDGVLVSEDFKTKYVKIIFFI
jgi:hypothetical protein